jgi:glycosyltransferase involved in cell wall biosynthesis
MTKVLIVHPDFARLGGIETYLLKISRYLDTPHAFCAIAQRPGESTKWGRLTRIISDYQRFWKLLNDHEVETVHLNPSLEPKSFFREALFLSMARLRGKKTLVFFHGWRPGFQRWLDLGRGRLFRLLYGRADALVVLAEAFKSTLQRWDVHSPIHRETTVIDDDAIEDFDFESAVESRLNEGKRLMVFASRLMRTKGLDTTIAALALIRASRPEFELMVVGSGEHAAEAKALAARVAPVLCFPTEHDEGCPNIIIEAMSFGLPVVTRPVGGIPNFLKPGKHGYLTDSTDPKEFAELVLRVMQDPDQYRAMAYANYTYAREHFLASRAASRLDKIYKQLQATG